MLGNMPNFNWMLFGMPGMNMGNNFMPNMNMGGNDFWQNIYGNGFNMPQNMNQNQQQDIYDKLNVVFKTTGGLKMNVFVNVGTSISDTILLFLKRVGKTELFRPNSGIYFLCNARKLNIYDKTPIDIFTGGQINPVIMVNDVQNLIGA